MNQARTSERSIFIQAIDFEHPDERKAFLDRACGGDETLRNRVEELLAAHDQPDLALDHPPVPSLLDTMPSDEAAPSLGQTIGPYRLMEQIGEGGFGLVFVAHQEHPVQRMVALKIIKPGTATKEVIARFEAERQAVAMMDHPNIAQVFDAGITDDGRPYFVMELVRGVPITEFADAHQTSIDGRLRLMMDVCSAVHHAHQKGVIHRDIKPSNVMVTLHDDRPVVKVIDFGVAKAIGQTLTDKTIYTRFFSMIGTPLYMSPEQAEMSGLDVDTRSDIYSLGVLMYELLVGQTPFDRERLDSASLDELRQIIREEEPPRPSHRVTTVEDRMTKVAQDRCVDPRRLSSVIRGDLDWIVMKALEKDRNRRYDSAAAMSEDISRHLVQQPIHARPPSLSYSLIKLAKRQRVALATLSMVGLAMILGTGVSVWQMNQAIRERDLKEQALREATIAKQEVEQFVVVVAAANGLVASAQTHANAGRWAAAIADLDSAVRQQPNYSLPWVSRAQFFTRMNLWQEGADDYLHALSLGASTESPAWWGVMALFNWTENIEAARDLGQQMDTRLERTEIIEDWEFVRNFTSAHEMFDSASLDKLVQWAEENRGDANGRQPPDRRGPPDGYGPPERRRPNEGFGPPNRGDRDDFGPPPQRPPREGMDQRPHPARFDSRPGGDPPPRNIRDYITGLLHLRAGNFEQAIELLEESLRRLDWPTAWLVDAPMAIAYHHLGRADDAMRSLRTSDESFPAMLESLERNDTQRFPWFDYVEMLCFHREATLLIRGEVSQPTEQLDEIRNRALTQLSLR